MVEAVREYSVRLGITIDNLILGNDFTYIID